MAFPAFQVLRLNTRKRRLVRFGPSNLQFGYAKCDAESSHRQVPCPGEGWGLANDGNKIIMSDGTSTLRFLDPMTFQETGRLMVNDKGRKISRLNELEYIRGEIYANIWQTDRVARISPITGQVLGWIDLQGLLSEVDKTAPVDVLNGIAYDSQKDRLFLTGKLWPKLFEIKIIPRH